MAQANVIRKYLISKFKVLASISKETAAKKAFELFTTPQTRSIKELPPVFKKGESLSIAFEDYNVQGYRWNHPKDKKILILHGYESSSINFEHFVNPLIKKGYEVIAFDAPAHGRSGGKSVHALIYKDFILHINSLFGPITSFLTHSFGGLAISLAMEEMAHDDSFKIVFIAPATETTTAVNNFFKYLKLDNDVRIEFDKVITEANNQPPSWYSVARAADNIKAQVLFIQDKEDEQTPFFDVEPIKIKQYSNFRFIITEGLGHSRIYRDKEIKKAIIEFL